VLELSKHVLQHDGAADRTAEHPRAIVSLGIRNLMFIGDENIFNMNIATGITKVRSKIDNGSLVKQSFFDLYTAVARLLNLLNTYLPNFMCEFCNVPGSNTNRDASHQDFAGFFSADAIEAAVRQVSNTNNNASHPSSESDDDDDSPESDDDSDGT
jgi:hypothetical protein